MSLLFISKKALQTYLAFAQNTALEAGKLLMSYYGEIYETHTKSNKVDLLTTADIKADQLICQIINKKYPKHNILTEESGLKKSKNNEFTWIIDPLDGTTNFIHSLPIFSVSIALEYNKETIIGVVYNPAAKKLFYAAKHCGAYLNNKPIIVSETKKLENSLLVTGFPYKQDAMWNKSFDLFKEFYSKTQGIRRLGSASLDYCFVAMGRFDGFYEFNLNPWDILAGQLIVNESRGRATNWNNKNSKRGKRILATNNLIHNEMLNILNQSNYKNIFNID